MTPRKPNGLDKIHQDLIDILKRVKVQCEDESDYALLIQNLSKSIEVVHSLILKEIKES